MTRFTSAEYFKIDQNLLLFAQMSLANIFPANQRIKVKATSYPKVEFPFVKNHPNRNRLSPVTITDTIAKSTIAAIPKGKPKDKEAFAPVLSMISCFLIYDFVYAQRAGTG